MQARRGTFVLALVVLGLLVLVAVLSLGGDRPAEPGGQSGSTPADAPPPARPQALTSAPPAPQTAVERAEVAREQVAPARPAPAKPGIALSGRLVQAGAPVPDVVVRYGGTPLLGGLPVLAGGTDGEAQEQRTGRDGRFRFVVPAEAAGRLTLGSDEYVLAGSEGDALLVTPAAADRDLGDLELAPAAMLAGVVRDGAGAPLEGVEVALSTSAHPALAVGIGGRRTRTGADGRFSFGGLRGAAYRLATASPRHLPAAHTVEIAAGSRRDDLVLTLEPGSSIWGRVVDDRGEPVAGASVGAYRQRELEGMRVRELAHGEAAQTDASGTFQLGGIDRDTVTVRAWRDGHQPVSASGVRTGTGDLVLVMPRLGAIEGRLLDAAGEPIAGSRIVARPSGAGQGPVLGAREQARSDADGRFRLENVAPGETVVEAEGHAHVTARASATVQPGRTTEDVVLVAPRGAAIAALVVDARGQPVAGATVEVTAGEGEGLPAGVRTRRVERRRTGGGGGEDVFFDDGSRAVLGEGTTGADGRVVVGGLQAGPVRVRAQHGEHAPSAPLRLALPASGTVDAKLALRPGGAVELRIVDADGAPLPQASVVVEGPEGSGAETHPVQADGDGIARLAALPEGTYTAALRQAPRPMHLGGASVVIAGGAGDVLEGSRTPLLVRAGETTQTTLVQPILTTVTGTLRDAAGTVAGGTVELRAPDQVDLGLPGQSPYSATTGADGRFAIEGVAPGRYTLRYGRKGQHVLMRESLALHGERVVDRDLVLDGGIVALAVLDADGAPLRGAKVTVRPAEEGDGEAPRGAVFLAMNATGAGEHTMELGGATSSVRTGADGTARIADVPPGEYAVEIEHEHHVRHRVVDVRVAARQTNDLGAIALEPAGALTGSIEADGGPPMVASVEALRAGESSPRSVMAMQGSFRFDSLPPGTYQVRARALGGGSNPWGPAEEVVVAGGETGRVTVRL